MDPNDPTWRVYRAASWIVGIPALLSGIYDFAVSSQENLPPSEITLGLAIVAMALGAVDEVYCFLACWGTDWVVKE
jgi:hypothetical protein